MGDIVDRAMEIGSAFLAWTEETGPCPINIVDTSTSWGKRLCALFEKQAELETEIERLRDDLETARKVAIEEIAHSNHLAAELEKVYANNQVCWEEPGESSHALIAHKNRIEQTNG